MPGDLTKADIPFGGGQASTGRTMAVKTWQKSLGFFLLIVSAVIGIAIAMRAIAFGNRQLGTGLALPSGLQPDASGASAGGVWEGV